MSFSRVWGVHLKEQKIIYPCDKYVLKNSRDFYRGVTINANPKFVYLWLCQMNYAPYSYDWLDNFAFESPNYLIKDADQLKIGQKFMYAFKLLDFVKNRHITFTPPPHSILDRLYGQFVVSYFIKKVNSARTRVIVKIRWSFPKGIIGSILCFLAPKIDSIMMRKQLSQFKKLSEKTQFEYESKSFNKSTSIK